MKKLFTKWPWLRVIEGILLVVLGLLIGILGGIDYKAMSKALSITVAIFLFLDGTIALVSAILEDSGFSLNLVIGGILISFGAILFTQEFVEIIPKFLSILVGILLLSLGGGSLAKGISQISKKKEIKWIFINFLITTICVTLGVLALLFRDEGTINVIYIILGTSVTVLGVLEIIFASLIIKSKKKVRLESSRNNVTVIEADATRKQIEINSERKSNKKEG